MLKGAIDTIHPQRLGGWLYSSAKSVRGCEVLAFVDERCVGSGQVGVFRQDLLDANLGDGYLGFSFPISLTDQADCGRVVVRLSDSDFVLLAPRASIRSFRRFDDYVPAPYISFPVEFMRKRGWLKNAELSFIRFIRDIGVFDLSLIEAGDESCAGNPRISEAPELAAAYLSLAALSDSTVVEMQLCAPAAEDLLDAVKRKHERPFPLIAIQAKGPVTLDLVEGSHKDELRQESLFGSVEYLLGPDRLCFLSPLCKFAMRYDADEVALRIFTINVEECGS